MKRQFVIVLLMVCLILSGTASAGVGSKFVREATEILARRGAKEVVGETAETLARKMSTLAARHGDDLVTTAFKRVGPQAGRIASEAGEHSGIALRFLSKHGDDAIRLASRPKALKLAARFSDDVAKPLMKHGEIAEDLIEKFGPDATQALGKLSEKNGRRLAILAKEQGDKLTPDLVKVIAKHGDSVAEWVWKRKGSLFVGAALATFVAQPEAYLDTAETIATKTLDVAVKPLADVPVTVAAEAAAKTNWTLISICILVGVSLTTWYATRLFVRPFVRLVGTRERPKENGVPWPRKDS